MNVHPNEANRNFHNLNDSNEIHVSAFKWIGRYLQKKQKIMFLTSLIHLPKHWAALVRNLEGTPPSLPDVPRPLINGLLLAAPWPTKWHLLVMKYASALHNGDDRYPLKPF